VQRNCLLQQNRKWFSLARIQPDLAFTWHRFHLEMFYKHNFNSVPRSHLVTVTLDCIVVTQTSKYIGTVMLDTTVTFIIPVVVLLILSMMWHKEQVWNFSVFQGVHLSNLVTLLIIIYVGTGSRREVQCCLLDCFMDCGD
jgi:hypothetical protein